MKDWIPVVSAFVGFLAGFAGQWLTQRANRTLEAEKSKREQEKTKVADRKQLFIDIVEYAEDRAAWLRSLEWHSGNREAAKLSLHPTQLAGRAKLSAPYWVAVAWDDFDAALTRVDGDLFLGNYRPHDDLPDVMEWDNPMGIPRALVAGEILIAAVRAAHEEESFSELVEDLLVRLEFQTDRRLIDASNEWKICAETEDGRWYGSLTGHPKAIAPKKKQQPSSE